MIELTRLKPLDRVAYRTVGNRREAHRTLENGLLQRTERLLWRIENESTAPQLMVQSGAGSFHPAAIRGRWMAQQKTIDPIPSPAQLLSFRLHANPTLQRAGKRIGIVDEAEQVSWLRRKLDGITEVVQVSTSRRNLVRQYNRGYDVVGVQFDGILRVIDPDSLVRVIETGIGRSRHLGFGLLSVAQLR